ncbi:uncharacterized protein JCM15063_005418 [Sporobolomyces koalae]|uniref:uncharacterized protein n=1 Tax=Sporobolomyces koalae TaxID=500713 RepID=UPI0031789C55
MVAPIRLPSDRTRSSAVGLESSNPFSQFLARLRRVRGFTDAKRVCMFSVRLAQLPLRIRPFFLLTTFVALSILSVLGFHPTLATHLAPPSVPFSDKVLHFVCFLFATTTFYHIWVVEDHARKVFVGWRWFNEILTFAVCCIVGGICSEFVQSLLPYKTFQFGDVFANLFGSGLGLWSSWKRARDARRDKELRRLYVRMGQFDQEEDDDSDHSDHDHDRDEYDNSDRLERGLLPSRESNGEPRGGRNGPASTSRRDSNPWDDQDDDQESRHEGDIFDLGAEEDEVEDEVDQQRSRR